MSDEPTVPVKSVVQPMSYAVAERGIEAELTRQFGPRLAGLFRLCLEFRGRLPEPGASHIFAFTAREVLNTVLRVTDDRDGNEQQAPDDKKRNAFRQRVARVLELPETHLAIDRWTEVSEAISAAHHHGKNEPSDEAVGQAVEHLIELLWVFLAPYFDVEAETAALLAIEVPTSDAVIRLQRQLGRRRQRSVFFHGLQHPGWVEPLRDAGFFRTVPDVVEVEGGWQAQAWPEGEYLMRMGSHKPREVVELFATIDRRNRNPVVWNVVVDTASKVSAEFALPLVGMLIDALRQHDYRTFWMDDAVELVGCLTERGAIDAAFTLAEALLQIREPELCQSEDVNVSLLKAQAFRTLIGRYEFDRFASHALPAMLAADPVRTLRVLRAPVDFVVTWHQKKSIARAAINEDLLMQDDHSDSWASDMDSRLGHDQPERAVAWLLWECVRRLASGSAIEAKVAWDGLATGQGWFYQRLRFVLLSLAGEHLVHEEAAFVCNRTILQTAGYKRREIAEWLRGRFCQLPSNARAAIVNQLNAGPHVEELARQVTYQRERRGHEGYTERDAIATWQIRWIQSFEDALPDELCELARQLGYIPYRPTVEERSLREAGVYGSGGMRGEYTPLSEEALAVLSPTHIATQLATWIPPTDSSDAPSRRGLHSAVRNHTREHPERAFAVLNALAVFPDAEFISDGVSALLGALRDVVGREQQSVSSEISGFCVDAITRWLPRLSASNIDGQSTCSALEAAISLTADLAKRDAFIEPTQMAMWDMLIALCTSPALRDVPSIIAANEVDHDFSGLSLNRIRNVLVEALIEVAMCVLRFTGSSEITAPHSRVVEGMSMALSVFDTLPVTDRNVVYQVLGMHLPQLRLLAPTWVEMRLQEELPHVPNRQQSIPLFSGWLRWHSSNKDTFVALRPLLRGFAEAIKRRRETGSADSTAAGGLARHVLWALLYGFCELGDTDELVEVTFAALPAKAMAHAYWTVFRAFEETKDAPDPRIVERLIGLWRWRLDALDHMSNDGSARRAEEAEGLLWFLHLSAIPALTRVDLGTRTVRHCQGRSIALWGIWEHVALLAHEVPTATISLLEVLVNCTDRTELSSLPAKDVRAALTEVMKVGDDMIVAQGRHLIHRLGENGGPDLRDLL